MNKEEIKKKALQCGFKLKQQPDGNMDLNPYVYDFARSLLQLRDFDYVNLIHFDDVKEGETYIDEQGFKLFVTELSEFGAAQYNESYVGVDEWDEWKWNLLKKAGEE